MDNLKCNRLTCRKSLTEKAVVTTCSHIFCVECANELFNASRLCPACDTSLTEPDDVVVCSLNPSNDYKTSVLSGLNPAVILEICSRALSFWQYQVHQEHSFQQAVIRTVNEKNAQMQKELHNVVREANGEISILNTKLSDIQRDVELERRKATGLQEAVKERDKEYQKLKALLDRIKRKSLLAPGLGDLDRGATSIRASHSADEGNFHRGRPSNNDPIAANVDVGAVVGNMEAHGIQRTPIVNRTMQPVSVPASTSWRAKLQPQRQPFGLNLTADRSFRSTTASEQSDSAGEVETMINGHPVRRQSVHGAAGWGVPHGLPGKSVSRAFAQGVAKRSGVFRPAGVPG